MPPTRPLKPVQLDPTLARRIALQAQGLLTDAPYGLGLAGAQRALEHLGYVQIDTIAVVERAHHHVLWSRVPDYRPEMLDQLIQTGTAYEYWSHAASFLPMRDFRYSLPRMRHHRAETHWAEDTPELRKAMKRVIRSITERGALRLRDFEAGDAVKTTPGAWGSGKIERRALHELFMRGALMITARGGFEKVYDLRERVLPANIDTSFPTPNQVADFLIRRTLRAHGIAREAELHYMQRGAFAATIRQRLAKAVKRRDIVPVHVGESSTLAYTYASTLDTASPLQSAEPPRARILSPFDNLVIQRARLRWLFDYDYQIECYVPAAKRRYGHFVLPVLYGDKLVARLEAKAHRSRSLLEVTNVWPEPHLGKDRAFTKALDEEIAKFATFNGCTKWEKSKSAAR